MHAVELVENTRGVRAVINRLEVSGSAVSDAELGRRIRAALNLTRLKPDGLSVQASAGHVVLSGSVPSLALRERAARAAWSVYGVTQVANRLTVKPDVERSDPEIERDVRERLATDSYLFGQPVEVSVVDGVIHLSGEVDTAFAERRARMHASVAGARAIEDANLQVSSRQPERGSAPAPASGESIERAVLQAYRLDPRVPESGIMVEARAGVVTLRGTVATLAEKRAAGEDALDASGAWGVYNQLTLRPTAPLTDGEVERLVKERLAQHPYVEGGAVRVAVTDGNVLLSGAVGSRFERDEAERVAALVPGVASVENRVTSRNAGDDSRTDAELRADLERELKWDQRVDSSRLRVQVSHGTVTVAGEVGDWLARDAVLQNVYEVAPPRFVNQLTVRQSDVKTISK
jgi:osmotically-inducible protein OsmY